MTEVPAAAARPPFLELLKEAVRTAQSHVCVGLDPEWDLLPPDFQPVGKEPGEPGTADAISAFHEAIIKSTSAFAAAYKLNLAFYEQFGPEGSEALFRTCHAVRLFAPRAVLIADGKRGDFSNTSKAIARALFDVLDFDAATVNPYLGKKALMPFFEREDRGSFVLCLTSELSELQDTEVHEDTGSSVPLYVRVAELVSAWDEEIGHNNLGLVAAATQAHRFEEVRIGAPEIPFLIPAVGEQRGDLETAVSVGFRGDGSSLVNSSRQITYAFRTAGDSQSVEKSAETAAKDLRDRINAELQREHLPTGPRTSNSRASQSRPASRQKESLST